MKKSAGIGVGSTTMMIIFVVLCLCTFATLSFVSARVDNRLSRDAANALTAYYKADDAAIEQLYKIETTLDKVPYSADEATYLRRCEKLIVDAGICKTESEGERLFSFSVLVDERRELNVVFKLVVPTSHSKRHTLLQKWQTASPSSGQITLEEPLNLWNGEETLQ